MSVPATLIKQVLKEQRQAKIPKDFVKRDAYQKLQKYSKSSEVVVITGLRRVGKSTLLQQLRNESSENGTPVSIAILPIWKWAKQLNGIIADC